MIALLAILAFAQEPQAFAPIPADVNAGGETLSGILVDEETFMELGRLRVQAKSQSEEIEAFEIWKDRRDQIASDMVAAIQQQSKENIDSMRVHYEDRLRDAERRTFFEKHGFPMGVGFGFASAVVLSSVTVFAMSSIYQIQIVPD